MINEDSKLALLGGQKSVTKDPGDIFKWPIVTVEDEEAVLDVLRRGAMSGTDITQSFECEFAEWIGARYALAHCNGTACLHAAMWACGVGAGDEIICPSMTYWASCAAALSLGATVNFADINPDTLCVDPNDLEHRIGQRTKAIVVVHYAGYPCEMEQIMEIAKKYNVKVIEDVSHAHGALYEGKRCGVIGDIAGMSMMAGKGFAIGEGGMVVTNDRNLYERCVAYGHYERTGVTTRWGAVNSQITDPDLAEFSGAPLGCVKHRLNQTCSAMGRVQLRHFGQRTAEIQRAMNRFWDMLEGIPGVRPHRTAPQSGSSMGCWYFPHGLYRSEELAGLPCENFCEAVRAEGVAACAPGGKHPLHLHPLFHTADIFNMGKPTAIAFGQRDVRQGASSLPNAERIKEIAFTVPWFKHDRPEIIEEYAAAFRKVASHYARRDSLFTMGSCPTPR